MGSPLSGVYQKTKATGSRSSPCFVLPCAPMPAVLSQHDTSAGREGGRRAAGRGCVAGRRCREGCVIGRGRRQDTHR